MFLAFIAPAPVPSAVMDQVLTYGVENVAVCNSAKGKSSLPTCKPSDSHCWDRYRVATMDNTLQFSPMVVASSVCSKPCFKAVGVHEARQHLERQDGHDVTMTEICIDFG